MEVEETVDFVKYYLCEKSTGSRISCLLQDKYKNISTYTGNTTVHCVCEREREGGEREGETDRYKK